MPKRGFGTVGGELAHANHELRLKTIDNALEGQITDRKKGFTLMCGKFIRSPVLAALFSN